jgi:hypothetical protein
MNPFLHKIASINFVLFSNNIAYKNTNWKYIKSKNTDIELPKYKSVYQLLYCYNWKAYDALELAEKWDYDPTNTTYSEEQKLVLWNIKTLFVCTQFSL